MRYRIIAFVAFVALLLDQGTKALVLQQLPLDTGIPVTSFFSLVHVQNHGAAFGFLNDPSTTWQFWLFALATLAAIVVVVVMARSAKDHDRMQFVAFGAIVGGAIGNFIDRVRFRAVVDFLDFHWAGWHWPAFNVADVFICCGAILLVLHSLRAPTHSNKESKA